MLARVGAASLAAHQIAFQLFVFLALVLDALAIAAQVIVGRLLGAGDAARRAGGGAAGDPLVGRGRRRRSASALVALTDVLPRAFTDDALVVERAHEIWWLFAAMMPVNGAVFALDGILIGAGDTRFLMWGMLAAAAVYVPVALLALHQGWGIVGVWAGLAALIGVRALTCGLRFAGQPMGAHRRARVVPCAPHAPPRTLVLIVLLALLVPAGRRSRRAARSARCRGGANRPRRPPADGRPTASPATPAAARRCT